MNNEKYIMYGLNGNIKKINMNNCIKIIKINKIYKFPYLTNIKGVILFNNQIIPVIETNINEKGYGILQKNPFGIIIIDRVLSGGENV